MQFFGPGFWMLFAIKFGSRISTILRNALLCFSFCFLVTRKTYRMSRSTEIVTYHSRSAHSAIRQKEVGHLMLFTQQKSYHFYTTEVLFQTEKEVSKIKLVYVSIADHLLHSSYPYPLDQRELVDKSDNF